MSEKERVCMRNRVRDRYVCVRERESAIDEDTFNDLYFYDNSSTIIKEKEYFMGFWLSLSYVVWLSCCNFLNLLMRKSTICWMCTGLCWHLWTINTI